MAPEKKKKTENDAEASSEPLSSKNRSSKSLMPRHKIGKKKYVNTNFTKINKLKGSPQVEGKKGKTKKKIMAEVNKESASNEMNDAKKLSLQNPKTKENLRGLQKSKLNEKNKKGHSDSERNRQNQRNKEKQGELGKSHQKEKKKEKLGGLIFMCSAKTKPDCFRYRVMGVPMSKKDLVLAVKPGLKLFLYDFDLRLMYGIYKASSPGSMKLEPAAFGGAFPVQVHFNVHQDCYPLPESVFKKAIKENYNEKHKFKMELTIRQVKKLIKLFRPAEVRSDGPSTLPPPLAIIHNREVSEGAKEPCSHSHTQPVVLDPYGEVGRYFLLSHENNQRFPHAEFLPVDREEFPGDSFLSEKAYRTYGLLRREKHDLTPLNQHFPHREVPTVEKEEFLRDSFLSEKEYRTYGLRREKRNLTSPNQHFSHREVPPLEKEEFPQDSFLSEKEYRTYGLRRENRNLTSPNQHFSHREVPPLEKEEFPQDSFLSEKEYRTYGLRRGRHNLTSATSYSSPILGPYPRVHARQHLLSHSPTTYREISPPSPYPRVSVREHLLGHPATTYRETAPPSGEITHHDPLLLNEKEYRTYGHGARLELQHPIATATTTATLDYYVKYPYYTSHYGAPSADPYPPTSRGEEIDPVSHYLSGSRETYLTETEIETNHSQRRDTYLTETDHSQRRDTYLTGTDHLGKRENDDLGRLYSRCSPSALFKYNKIYEYQGARSEPSRALVSSHYTFAGPSSSYC